MVVPLRTLSNWRYINKFIRDVIIDLHCTAVAGTELSEIQKQIDNLPVKTDPESVGQLLSMRRDVLFLEFDIAVRHSVRDTFLATGNIPAYKVVTCLFSLYSSVVIHIVVNFVCITAVNTKLELIIGNFT